MKKLVIIALAALIALPAMATKPLTFVASEEISYDDNIYLNHYGKKDAGISTTRVGANYNTTIPNSALKFNANALVGYNAYTRKHSLNNYWDALGGVELSNKQFKIGDKVLYTSDYSNEDLDVSRSDTKRLQNDAYVSYVTSTEKMFGVGVFAQDIYKHYFEDAMKPLTRNRLNLGAQLYYNMSPKTNFFVEYMFSDIEYKEDLLKDNNSKTHSVGLGVKGQVAPKVTGIAKVTYDMRKYDEEDAYGDDEKNLVGYLLSLEWKPSTVNTIRLTGERGLKETIYGDNRYFKDTTLSLYADQKLSNKLTAHVTLIWDQMHYDKYVDSTKRADDVFLVRPGVDYKFKDWLTAGVWYQFRARHSNLNAAEYENNRAGVFVRALF